MKKWFKRLKSQKGMTLVELLAVVVILGIVAAIAVPAIGNIIDNSKKDAHKSNALLLINATKLGVVSGQITSADDEKSTTAGIQIPIEKLQSKGLLDTIPSDPSVDTGSYSGSSSIVTYIKGTANTPTTYSIILVGNGNTYYNGATETQLNNDTATLTTP